MLAFSLPLHFEALIIEMMKLKTEEKKDFSHTYKANNDYIHVGGYVY